jgi:hypothetical protein
VNEAGYARDHGHHDHGQCVDSDRPVGLEGSHINPRHQRQDMGTVRRSRLDGMPGFVNRHVCAADPGDVGKELEQ